MQTKTKKLIITSTIIFVFIAVVFFLFIAYLTNNGFKNYSGFCSKYINQIEQYKIQTGIYPSNLLKLKKPSFSFRYDIASCGYYSQKDFYGFAVPEALIGISFYSSVTSEWSHD